MGLAEAVVEASHRGNGFKFLYLLDLALEEKFDGFHQRRTGDLPKFIQHADDGNIGLNDVRRAVETRVDDHIGTDSHSIFRRPPPSARVILLARRCVCCYREQCRLRPRGSRCRPTGRVVREADFLVMIEDECDAVSDR